MKLIIEILLYLLDRELDRTWRTSLVAARKIKEFKKSLNEVDKKIQKL